MRVCSHGPSMTEVQIADGRLLAAKFSPRTSMVDGSPSPRHGDERELPDLAGDLFHVTKRTGPRGSLPTSGPPARVS